MNILIIGRSGQVARALVERARETGIAVSAVGRPLVDLELTSTDLEEIIRDRAPTVVINAAAYTAVENAEQQSARAFQINAAGAELVAQAAQRAGAAHILFSTDYVFAGDKLSPYSEADAVGPRSVYGRSKLEGEQRALRANPQTVILRTAWVYSAKGSNFVRTMLRLARSKPAIDVVEDQIGSPTFANDLAEAALTIAENLGREGGPFGVYNCAGEGGVSWSGFANAIFAEARARGGPFAEVRPILARDFPAKVARPSNSQLDCSKLANDHRVRLPAWRDGLVACLDEIAAGGWSVE